MMTLSVNSPHGCGTTAVMRHGEKLVRCLPTPQWARANDAKGFMNTTKARFEFRVSISSQASQFTYEVVCATVAYTTA